uniref:Uncharacterized protein n=1 Tax=Nelumbo nucifera TaxID=4432 RepID=A0A822ZLM4_NELNU|nr:TPA_asm: hypothetical protein HUJ06_002595 [Nelumbo nucifera]
MGIFLTVSLNFAGSASMILSAMEYLIKQGGVVSFLTCEFYEIYI